MSVDQTNVVDFVSHKGGSDSVSLTISDHLSWDDPLPHIVTLQDKINTYLAFIESGQIHSEYPESIGKEKEIKIAFKFEPKNEGVDFLTKASEVIESAGICFRYEVYEE